MIDRRRLLVAGACAAAVAPIAARADTAGDTPHERLNRLFNKFVDEGLDLQPEGVTSIGMDSGPRAAAKSQLNDRSQKAIDAGNRLNEDQFKRLKAFDRASLTGMDLVNYDTVLFGLQGQVDAARRFNYAGGAAGSPYPVSQLGGAYVQLPDFLDAQHSIETKADAEAYVARLNALGLAIDQESDQVRHDAGLGVIPPDFILDKALIQLTGLRNTGADKSVLVQSLVRRTQEKHIDGDWSATATAIYQQKIQPALDRQIGLLKDLRAEAGHDAGVWRLPDGEAYYNASLLNWTTTAKTADQVHAMGLELVESLSARTDEAMKAQGLTQGTVGERFRGMFDDPRFRYANTDEGKDKLIGDLNAKVSRVQARLPEYFGVLPKARLEIRRVPKYSEAGSPGGYYQPGSLDGKRAGAYYINLRDTAEQPSWTLSTLSYHEGIPGHHLQLSIQQEADLPLIRKLSFFSAYQEGWALYAEQLADEMGMYRDDPFGQIGYYHDALFRAVRLVVDTGIHAKRWSREKAVAYMVEKLGDKDSAAITEVERYCVWPGQACTYMQGKLTFLRLRQQAKEALGPRFDIHRFHDAALLCAAVPLDVLDQVIAGYIKQAQA